MQLSEEQLNDEQFNELVSFRIPSKSPNFSERLKKHGKNFINEENILALVYLSQDTFTAQSDNDQNVVQVFNNLVLPSFDKKKLVKYFQSLEKTSLKGKTAEGSASEKMKRINKEKYVKAKPLAKANETSQSANKKPGDSKIENKRENKNKQTKKQQKKSIGKNDGATKNNNNKKITNIPQKVNSDLSKKTKVGSKAEKSGDNKPVKGTADSTKTTTINKKDSKINLSKRKGVQSGSELNNKKFKDSQINEKEVKKVESMEVDVPEDKKEIIKENVDLMKIDATENKKEITQTNSDESLKKNTNSLLDELEDCLKKHLKDNTSNPNDRTSEFRNTFQKKANKIGQSKNDLENLLKSLESDFSSIREQKNRITNNAENIKKKLFDDILRKLCEFLRSKVYANIIKTDEDFVSNCDNLSNILSKVFEEFIYEPLQMQHN